MSTVLTCISYLGDLKPKHLKYFQNPAKENAGPGLSFEGHHTEFLYNTSSRCGVNNTDCEEKLSLAMWMKNDVSKYTKEKASSSRRGNLYFLYYPLLYVSNIMR